MRLVALAGTAATSACGAVHPGAVEIFHDGRWGRICNDLYGTSPEKFTLDAHVVCRQLGFPFGTVIDAQDNAQFQYDYDTEEELVWATAVRPCRS